MLIYTRCKMNPVDDTLCDTGVKIHVVKMQKNKLLGKTHGFVFRDMQVENC